MADTASVTVEELLAERDALARDAEQLRDTIAKAIEQHPAIKIYKECGHRHDEGDLNAGRAVYVYEVGIVCADGLMYEVCGSCCWVEDYGQTEDCVTDHEDQHRAGWLCVTRDTLKGGDGR